MTCFPSFGRHSLVSQNVSVEVFVEETASLSLSEINIMLLKDVTADAVITNQNK